MEELKEILDNNDKYLIDMNNNQRVQAKVRVSKCLSFFSVTLYEYLDILSNVFMLMFIVYLFQINKA